MPLTTIDAIRKAEPLIQPYIRRTPLLYSDVLSRTCHKEVLVKCEIFQRTGSFKMRGASHCILQNLATAKTNGVVAASAGNHAQAVALMSSLTGIRSTIVMPAFTPPIKVAHTQRWGAEIQLVGAIYDEAYEHAQQLAKEKGYLFIHPFKDPDVMAGQGTIALEMAADPLFAGTEAVVIPIGGGGLAVGIATALKALHPQIKIYGVTPKNAPATYESFKAGKQMALDVKMTLAEGTANKRPDDVMLAELRQLLADVFVLTEESIAHGISLVAEESKMVLEGSGALGVAALLEDKIPEKKIALILSGGNIDLPAFSTVLHRGLVEQGRLTRITIKISDRPGGLHAVTQIFAEKRANILQVFHQRSSLKAALGETEIDVDMETKGPHHTMEILQALKERGFQVNRE
jgi:threonine dehydratase